MVTSVSLNEDFSAVAVLARAEQFSRNQTATAGRAISGPQSAVAAGDAVFTRRLGFRGKSPYPSPAIHVGNMRGFVMKMPGQTDGLGNVLHHFVKFFGPVIAELSKFAAM